MTQQTSFLINIFSFLLLSSSLLAGPMFEERPGQVNCKQQVEEQARNRTAGDEAPYSSEDKERNGASIASIAEVPLNTSEKATEIESIEALSSELIEPNQQVIVPTAPKERIEEAIRTSTKQLDMIKGKENEANQNGKTELVEKYQALAKMSEKAAIFYTNALKQYNAGKTNLAMALSNPGAVNIFIVQIELKAIEAERIGDTEFAERYREIAAQQNEALGSLTIKALKAVLNGETNQGSILSHADITTRLSGQAKLKAIEAERIGDTELAKRYREIDTKHEEAATLYMEALQKHDAGETDKGISLIHAGIATRLIAETNLKAIEADLKAIEADKIERTELARIYRVSAKRYRLSAEQQEQDATLYKEALQKYDAGETAKGIILLRAGRAMRLKAKARLKEIEADLKAIEADESGKTQLAELYRVAAERYRVSAAQQEKAARMHKKALKKYDKGETALAIALSDVGTAMSMKEEADLNMIKADKSKNPELAQRCLEDAIKQTEALEFATQTLQALQS